MMCKEEILGRVNTILQELQSIVSHLSEPSVSQSQCQCQNQDLWWEHEKIKDESLVSIAARPL